jgi:MFS family permease
MLQPALPSEHAARLAELTRAYARFDRACGGLATVLGGLFALALFAVDLARHGWSWSGLDAFGPRPAPISFLLVLLPFLWLTCRLALGRLWYQRFGRVTTGAGPDPRERARARRLKHLGPVLGLLPLGLLAVRPGAQTGVRAGLVVLLAAGLAFGLPRVAHGRLERALGVLLFLLPACFLAGLQNGLGSNAILLGAALAAVLQGLREHVAWRRLTQELRSVHP